MPGLAASRPLLLEKVPWHCGPEDVLLELPKGTGRVCLRSGGTEGGARYSLVTAEPFLRLSAWGTVCELRDPKGEKAVQYGNPWRCLEEWLARYELLDVVDQPFPLGGCFGFWGYDLKHFTEPRVRPRAVVDVAMPDLAVGFYGSLVVWDHRNHEVWVIAAGLGGSGDRSVRRARADRDKWVGRLERAARRGLSALAALDDPGEVLVRASLDRESYVAAVRAAQRLIRAGDIYQVNLARRLTVAGGCRSAEALFLELSDRSPAPYGAFVEGAGYVLCSSSPEMFLRLDGRRMVSRPIKGTRPRSGDATEDLRLAHDLQTNAKEIAELVMITDLVRNDLGKVCEFGSVQVPDLLRLERFAHVQHLVSTVEGRLREGVGHVAALEACFPGGSITGAPKIRAMEIIEDLEPVARGAYTGCLGYLGFNGQSQLGMTIRTAVHAEDWIHYATGAGIVADSDAEAEYVETEHKARAFLEVVRRSSLRV